MHTLCVHFDEGDAVAPHVGLLHVLIGKRFGRHPLERPGGVLVLLKTHCANLLWWVRRV